MNVSKISLRALGMLVCFAVVLCSAHAQYRASIQGVVTDPGGGVVSGVTVTLKNLETNQTVTATTDDNGIYNFNGLPPSQYSITVEKQGFKKKVLDAVGVIAEQANAVNVQLEIGQATETVTVNGDSTPLIDTETANTSGTVDAEQIQKLPSFGRDPFQLLQLAPGAFGDGAQGAGGGTSNLPGTTIGGTGGTDGIFKTENGGQIVANGARTGENNYTIDGVSMTSVSWGGTAVITPNEDSIKEVKIITDNYDAENGRYRGAQIQIISQNGTNQYHGSAFFKAHRPGLDAFQRYNGPGNGLVRDDGRFNDFGGTVGGPILRNKLFVFFSYETLRNNQAGVTAGGWYETSQFRALAPSGSNAAKFLTFPGVAPSSGTVAEGPNDSHTCTDIGLTEGPYCHFIAGQGLDLGSPLKSALGTSDPSFVSQTQPGFGSGLDGVADVAFIQSINSPSQNTQVQYNGRIDFNVTSRDLIAFTIYHVPVTSTSINGNGTREMNLFHHSVINEARVNAAGWRWKDLDNNPQGAWGLPPIVFNTIGTSLSPNGFGLGAPGTFDQWTYAVKDTLTKVHNSHTLKMGGEVTRLLFVDNAPWNARPQYNFNNMWDFLNDAPATESATFNPVTGVPTDFRKDTRSTLYGFFIQDNYKVKPNLTVTLGLRWEYFGPISEKNGHLASTELGTGADLLSGIRVRVGGNLYQAQKANFGPQLGFAWSPGGGIMGHEFNSKLVIRGGFGIAYNGLDEAISLNGRSNPPFLSAAGTLTGSQIVYANSFPANVHSFGGYASNPATIENFDPTTNLPIAGPNFALVSLTGYPANWPTTYSYHFSLGAEYDLGHQWVASLEYQGSTTRHLTQQYNLYDVAGAHGLAFNPVVTGVDWYANDGSARFNALLAELHHRFSRSFELDTQYRYSSSLDTGSNNFANGFYQYNIATNFAPSDYDTRNAFKLWGVWSPTIFHGSQSWMEKVAGGWALSGILNAHSGFPWNPSYSLGELDGGFDPLFSLGQNAGGSSSAGGAGGILPSAYLGGFVPNFRSSASNPNGGKAFFTAPTVTGGPLFACVVATAITAQCPKGQVPLGPIPTPPGIGRNSFRGPGYFDIDASLSKSFGLPRMRVLGEGAKLEFRANFYNLFNKLNLTNLQTDITSTHFGEAQNALGARVIEMQARFSF
jgi:Carboxypeptidase regulatory-like domain/TonB dependent receptor